MLQKHQINQLLKQWPIQPSRIFKYWYWLAIQKKPWVYFLHLIFYANLSLVDEVESRNFQMSERAGPRSRDGMPPLMSSKYVITDNMIDMNFMGSFYLVRNYCALKVDTNSIIFQLSEFPPIQSLGNEMLARPSRVLPLKAYISIASS